MAKSINGSKRKSRISHCTLVSKIMVISTVANIVSRVVEKSQNGIKADRRFYDFTTFRSE